MTNKSIWMVAWGRTSQQIAEDYIASGKAVRRKDGAWDMRYKASRYVHLYETVETLRLCREQADHASQS